jgi:hypothetical protein
MKQEGIPCGSYPKKIGKPSLSAALADSIIFHCVFGSAQAEEVTRTVRVDRSSNEGLLSSNENLPCE